MQNRDRQMRGCAKAEQSDAVSRFNAGDTQTAKADDARAEERSRMEVVEFRGKLKNKVAARLGILGVTSVDGVSRKDPGVAKIFELAAAVGANPVYAADPGNSDAGAERQVGRSTADNVSDDLVTGDEGLLLQGQIAFDDMQVGAAYAASANAQQNLTWRGLRLGRLFNLKRLLRSP